MTLHPQPLLDVHDELIVDLFAGGNTVPASIEFEDGSYAEGRYMRMHWPETRCLEAHTAYSLVWFLDCCFFQPEGSRNRKKTNLPELVVRTAGRAT